MASDVFDRLAAKLISIAGSATPSEGRFRITKLSPLTVQEVGGTLSFDVEDDDVEIRRSVLDLLDADELTVGDVLVVRHSDDEFEIVGAVGDA